MTTITIDRAVVAQALETIEGLTRDRLFTAEWAGKHGATVTALRAALAQQDEPVEDVLLSAAGLALDALEHDRQAAARSGRSISMLSSRAIEELRGALRAARRVRQQDPGFWGSGDGYWIRAEDKAIRPDRERFTVAFYTAPPQQVAQQAEPLNLRDPAVQKRLAAQWGYVPAAQAEPVEPVAGVVLNEEGRAALVEYGREEWHCVVRNARRLYTAPPKDKPKPMHPELRKMWEDYFDKCFRAMPVPKQAEPVEPVDVGLLEYRGNSVAFIHQKMTAYRSGIDAAWDAFRAKGLHPDGKTSLADMIAKYTAPSQRKLVPLTDEEIKTAFHAARNAKLGASQDNSRHRLSVIEIARAVEEASWEKNNGQA